MKGVSMGFQVEFELVKAHHMLRETVEGGCRKLVNVPCRSPS